MIPTTQTPTHNANTYPNTNPTGITTNNKHSKKARWGVFGRGHPHPQQQNGFQITWAGHQGCERILTQTICLATMAGSLGRFIHSTEPSSSYLRQKAKRGVEGQKR